MTLHKNNFSAGILLSNHSPPISTPLECRVAPYVSVSSLRNSNTTQPQQFSSSAAAAAAFSAFDPALISAAHQVCSFLY